jgi:chemotaxis protein methyltransferase CheR
MRDDECIVFLQWALPQMGFRWPGFRKVRRQVCKRIGRRLRELGLTEQRDYREYLGAHPEEWNILDTFCRITISRFFRDHVVYETLGTQVLPQLTPRDSGEGEPILDIWSAGCGAGEEPYSVALLHRFSDNPALRVVKVRILATDSDPGQLARARRAVYPVDCTRELPATISDAAFERLDGDRLQLRGSHRESVEFACQDLRQEMPEGPFHLILCRNLAFTYFLEEIQRTILSGLCQRLLPGGYLVIGTHEHLPTEGRPLLALPHCPSILRRLGH